MCDSNNKGRDTKEARTLVTFQGRNGHCMIPGFSRHWHPKPLAKREGFESKRMQRPYWAIGLMLVILAVKE